MPTFINFVSGIILGLLLEAVLLWFFLRKQNSLTHQELAAYKNKTASLTKRQHALRAKNEELRSKIDTLKATKTVVVKKDKLEDINGIGPVFAKRLNNAGIMTFEELIEVPADRLEKIVEAKTWQVVEPEKWIGEARQFLS